MSYIIMCSECDVPIDPDDYFHDLIPTPTAGVGQFLQECHQLLVTETSEART